MKDGNLIDVQDKLSELEIKLERASCVESELYHQFFSTTEPDMPAIAYGYHNITTLHGILGDYLHGMDELLGELVGLTGE